MLPGVPKQTRRVVRSIPEEFTISLVGLLRHMIVALVLLGGAAAVGWVLINVHVPEIVYITLILLEVVVFLEVLNSLLPIVRASIRETKTTVLTLMDTVDEIREHRERRKFSLTISQGNTSRRVEAEVSTDTIFIKGAQDILQLLAQDNEAPSENEEATQ